MVEGFLARLKGWLNGSCGVYWKIRVWDVVDWAESRTATCFLLDGSLSWFLLLRCVFGMCGVLVETLLAGLEPGP